MASGSRLTGGLRPARRGAPHAGGPRRAGIDRVCGYPAGQVLAAYRSRPGRGARTDLRRDPPATTPTHALEGTDD